jgi:toxin-antitoxin system PIN domain toxin
VVFLADVNVLIALLHAEHPHSLRANAWLDRLSSPDLVGLCRITQMGLLRLMTNSRWLKSEAREADEVWSGWGALLADGRFRFLDEPSSLEREWRRLTAGLARGRMVETDSYLAAFAISAGIPIVTFDRGFERWPRLRVEIPA